MGVWIETPNVKRTKKRKVVTPCMGVWIETVAVNWCNNALIVTPCMGVWIETRNRLGGGVRMKSHPVWVCGLKHPSCVNVILRC